MAELKQGTIVLTIPDDLAPDPQAGKLSPKEIQRIPKVPRGIGLACMQAADSIRKAGPALTVPPELTPEALLTAGRRADAIDEVVLDCELVLRTLKQANLLFDAEAWELLRKLNNQVKAQVQFAPELGAAFKPLSEFFGRAAHAPKAPAADEEPTE